MSREEVGVSVFRKAVFREEGECGRGGFAVLRQPKDARAV